MKYHLINLTVRRSKNNDYVVHAAYGDDADLDEYQFERLYTCAGGGLDQLVEQIPFTTYRKEIEKKENVIDITDDLSDEDEGCEED